MTQFQYSCDQCGEAFGSPCYFVGNKKEYEQVKSQLTRPFLEDGSKAVCFKQFECPKCHISRQVPVLQIGSIGRK